MIDPASTGDWVLATFVASLLGGLTLLITRALRGEVRSGDQL